MARRPDYAPLDRPPQTVEERAEAASRDQTSETTVSTVLRTLTTYVPTETLTLYVARVAALPWVAGTAETPNIGHWIAFWIFLFFTPLAVWITFATKLVSDKKQLPLQLRYWPRWEMTAGTLAYVAWAVGLPNSPFAQFPWYSSAVAGFVVLITSTLLGMLAGLFQRPIEPTKSVQQSVPL